MNGDFKGTPLREHMAGKWQIPTLFVAIAALGLSILTYRSPASKIPFDNLRDDLAKLVEDGMYTSAITLGDRLLMIPEKKPRELAPVHAALGRARLLRADRSGAAVAAIGRAVIEHYGLAVDGGHSVSPDDHENLGRAHEWTGDISAAVQHYDVSIASRRQPGIDLRWRVAKLRSDILRAPPRFLHQELDALINDATLRADILVWAVRRKIELFGDENRNDEARALLDRVAPFLADKDSRLWWDYLDAYVLHRTGDSDGAETNLRHLRDRLTLHDELFARTAWLLGRVVLGAIEPERPAEAISFFKDSLSVPAAPVYVAAGELGIAEALVSLERFDEALDRFHAAIAGMKRLLPNDVMNPRAMEASLTVAADRLRGAGEIESALRFAREATTVDPTGSMTRRVLLLERLSDFQAAVARKKRAQADGQSQDADPEHVRSLRREARALLLESGEVQWMIAELTLMDEDRSSEAAWLAGERIHESGDARATILAVDRFMEEHPQSEFISRALRYKGQAQQALGQYAEAIGTYRRNQQRFPRTPDAGGTLIPLARCYIAMGKSQADLAEKTLRVILGDSDVFTPKAPEFADALYLLGDLLNRTGSYERAIPVLEEAMQRYPGDERTPRAQFLLGDCYRQSGMALKEDYNAAAFAGERQQLLAERKRRLRMAAGLFEQMAVEFESRDPTTLKNLDAIYLRHARLYQADCEFELGEYQAALALYERTAWIYKGTTTALAAYVQIVNCHVFTGDAPEALAALRRAQYLVATLPDGAFEDEVGLETRDDWRGYFDWVAKSELF